MTYATIYTITHAGDGLPRRVGECVQCDYPLRPAHATLLDWPGTREVRSYGHCTACAKRNRYAGLPPLPRRPAKPRPVSYMIYPATDTLPRRVGFCRDCQYPIRPRNARLRDWPGTRETRAAGQCSRCKNNEYRVAEPVKAVSKSRRHTQPDTLRTPDRVCRDCGTPLRPRGAPAEFYDRPTRVSRTSTQCYSCHKIASNNGAPVQDTGGPVPGSGADPNTLAGLGRFLSRRHHNNIPTAGLSPESVQK